ncbi:MAG: fumarylacetoacetate hydrolase family protein [Bdellovibrionales bacterium]|nr:fumarylacetoacetate hydrolase family protein [Ramlibacter sp.]
MKFVSYEGERAAGSGSTSRRTGVVHDGHVMDVSDLIEALPLSSEAAGALAQRGIACATGGMLRWLQAGEAERAALAASIRERLGAGTATLPALGSLKLYPPVSRPGKIVGVGRNYADHAKETGVAPFEKPRIIFKVPSSVTGSGAMVPKPALVQKMDFEGELGVVIGAFASAVTPQDALRHVGGYTLLNDLSAREFQFDITPPQTTFAKSMDGFCPIGPALVTVDEVPDPQALRLHTHVNGALVQDATTADMLFPVAVLISYISQYMTLEPGDVIATGTPAGIGAFRTPPVWLAKGDRVEVSIEPLGVLVTVIG